MHTAPDVLWLVLSLPLLAALGLAPALLAAPDRRLVRHERAQLLALTCAAGLVVNYAVATVVRDLRWMLLLDCAVAAASLAWAISRRQTALGEMFGMGGVRWLLAAASLLVAAGPILFEPLQGWDARSVWFFNAKRIFFGGGLLGNPDWTNPAYGFSHADYPMLLPLLGAQFAHAWGVWNEYIPKGSLLLLLMPLLFGLLGLGRRLAPSLLFLAAVLLLSTREFMWNGYADTYLALYGVGAMLYFARWLETLAPLDLATGAVFAGVALNLKNEGALLVVCLATALAFFFLASRRARALLGRNSLPTTVWPALLLPWVGFAGWAFARKQWHLTNDLALGAGSLPKIWQRVTERQLGLVADALVLQTSAGMAAALFAGTALAAWALRTRIPGSAWLPPAVGLLYFAGIVIVYLATPHNLAWHLSTSADRTMLLGIFAFLGATFLILEAMETRNPAPSGSLHPTGVHP